MICTRCGFPVIPEHECACPLLDRAISAEQRVAAIIQAIPNAGLVPWRFK